MRDNDKRKKKGRGGGVEIGGERKREREKRTEKRGREIDLRRELERGVQETMQQELIPRTGSPGERQEASEEEAGDCCRHPGPPGSTATLKVPAELMASDAPGPTAPSPSSQARLE